MYQPAPLVGGAADDALLAAGGDGLRGAVSASMSDQVHRMRCGARYGPSVIRGARDWRTGRGQPSGQSPSRSAAAPQWYTQSTGQQNGQAKSQDQPQLRVSISQMFRSLPDALRCNPALQARTLRRRDQRSQGGAGQRRPVDEAFASRRWRRTSVAGCVRLWLIIARRRSGWPPMAPVARQRSESGPLARDRSAIPRCRSHR